MAIFHSPNLITSSVQSNLVELNTQLPNVLEWLYTDHSGVKRVFPPFAVHRALTPQGVDKPTDAEFAIRAKLYGTANSVLRDSKLIHFHGTGVDWNAVVMTTKGRALRQGHFNIASYELFEPVAVKEILDFNQLAAIYQQNDIAASARNRFWIVYPKKKYQAIRKNLKKSITAIISGRARRLIAKAKVKGIQPKIKAQLIQRAKEFSSIGDRKSYRTAVFLYALRIARTDDSLALVANAIEYELKRLQGVQVAGYLERFLSKDIPGHQVSLSVLLENVLGRISRTPVTTPDEEA